MFSGLEPGRWDRLEEAKLLLLGRKEALAPAEYLERLRAIEVLIAKQKAGLDWNLEALQARKPVSDVDRKIAKALGIAVGDAK
jgi:hypothetical protein